MPVEGWLYFLTIFMIFASIVALEMKDLLSSIISVGMVGLAVAVAFLFLQAPDLALVQFVYEIITIVILILLLKSTAERFEKEREGKFSFVVKVLFIIAVLIAVAPLFSVLPSFGEPHMHVAERYLQEGARETGAANLVAAIILDYRAYDTLGEVTVLFVAILAVTTLLRRKPRKVKSDE